MQESFFSSFFSSLASESLKSSTGYKLDSRVTSVDEGKL